MKFAKPVAYVLFVSCLSAPLYAAPSSWDGSKSPLMSSAKEKIEDKQYEAAIYDLQKIVAKDSESADAFNLLGFTHRKLKRYAVAEEYYQKALQLDPKHKGALEYLGELYVETNQMDKANKMLSRLDDVCFFGCKEHRVLKEMIERKARGLETVSNW
jgi:cytochrome c-type biogenesis protein CcmH/NrfG